MRRLKQSSAQRWTGVIFVFLMVLSSLPAFAQSIILKAPENTTKNVDRLGIPLDGRKVVKTYYGREFNISTGHDMYEDIKIAEYEIIFSIALARNEIKNTSKCSAMINYYKMKKKLKQDDIVSRISRGISNDLPSQEALINTVKFLNYLDKYALEIEQDGYLRAYYARVSPESFNLILDRAVTKYIRQKLEDSGLSNEQIEEKLKGLDSIIRRDDWFPRFANNINIYNEVYESEI